MCVVFASLFSLKPSSSVLAYSYVSLYLARASKPAAADGAADGRTHGGPKTFWIQRYENLLDPKIRKPFGSKDIMKTSFGSKIRKSFGSK